MFRNYLLIAYRNLKRHKLFSFINISGLAVGMAACLVILLYASFELSYDNFHENGDRIFRVKKNFYVNGKLVEEVATNYPAVGPALKANFPEVAQQARLYPYRGGVVQYGQKNFYEEKVYFADPAFFTIFSFPFVSAKPAGLLTEANTGVISQRMARKYFGDQDPVGKVLELDKRLSFIISGVFKDIPASSHIKPDFVFSFSSLFQLRGKAFYETTWGSEGEYYTYLLLAKGTHPGQLEAKLPALIEKYMGSATNERAEFWLQPLRDIHLHSHLGNEAEANGSALLVQFLLIIAGFILVLAWFNYLSLSITRSLSRAKEVGVRKVMGSTRYGVIKQFMVEAALFNLLASLIAITVVQLSLPFLGELVAYPLPSLFASHYGLGVCFVLAFTLGTLLSGLYPALLLSSFNAVAILKGKLSNSVKGARLRKVLVVGQFAISLALVIGTAFVYEQLSYMQEKELGVEMSQMLVVQAPRVIASDSLYTKDLEAFKNNLSSYHAVKSFTASSAVPGKPTNWGDMIRKKEVEADKAIGASVIGVDYNFVDAYRVKIAAGRSFSTSFKTDDQAVLLNRKACLMMSFDKPEQAIGRQVVRIGQTFTVIGVIEDYHQKSLKEQIEPIIYHLRTGANSYYSLKIDTKNLSRNMAQVKALYEQSFPDNPFQYFFLDESFSAQYHAEKQLGQVFGLFSGLAIFVASLGLFGLASFATAQRTKEIGVRKVLGASTGKIVVLLNKDFVKLILVANFIAWPLAFWGVNKWLEMYAFHIDIRLSLFIVPALLVLLIALLTISIQTIKAAGANPVKALKYE